MPSEPSETRWNDSFSTGGYPAPRTASAGPLRTIHRSSPPSSSSGTSANSHVVSEPRDADASRVVVAGVLEASGVTARLHGAEEPHPPELRELALVRVEHEVARVTERGLENRALALAKGQRVGDLGRRARVPVRYTSKNMPCRWKLLIRSNSVMFTR